ncbi:MAG: dTMP kinase [Hyphomicrobium sp.]|nr:dTMP kinase [Hyphomicrobium sp.]
MFITFEGGEGSGKSTQARRLAEHLRGLGRTVVETREPGGSPFAERLRTLLLDPEIEKHTAKSEALLFYAARADHLEQVIRPALKRGDIVVCDRFSDSTRAYQGYGGTLDLKWLEALELLVVVPTTPDLTIIVDVPAEVGLARAMLRRQAEAPPRQPGQKPEPKAPRSLLSDRFEARDLSYHKRLREGFLEIAKREPRRCTVIDGNGPLDAVADRIWRAVEQRLTSAQMAR